MSLKGPEQYDLTVTTTEMHTGGAAVRIVESGFPVPQGKTLLDKMVDFKQRYDDFRKFVVWEPHGHADMFAILLVAPDDPEADVAAILLSNDGYITVCGHGCMALGRYVIDRGLLERPIEFPETTVNIQIPCGVIKTRVQVDQCDGVVKTGQARFQSVPSYVVDTDVEITLADVGKVHVDVAYSGSFFVFVAAEDLGLELGKSSLAEITDIAMAVRDETRRAVPVSHPENTAAIMNSTMVVDTRTSMSSSDVSTNVCIYAHSEADRSPCGSGTCARVTLMYHRGHMKVGQARVFRSGITGADFTATVMDVRRVGSKELVTVEVAGQGHYAGRSTFTLERGDKIGRGFLP